MELIERLIKKGLIIHQFDEITDGSPFYYCGQQVIGVRVKRALSHEQNVYSFYKIRNTNLWLLKDKDGESFLVLKESKDAPPFESFKDYCIEGFYILSPDKIFDEEIPESLKEELIYNLDLL